MTTIRKIVTSKIDGDNANNTSTSEVRPFGELAVYVDTENNGGPDKLELLMFDGARTHLRSKVLAKGTFYGGDADSGSQGDGIENLDTIKLIPDAELHYNDGDYGNDQYIVIDPTLPNHIHVRAGGAIDSSTATLFLGGEENNVMVSDSADQVAISTNSTHTWLFDLDGSLTVPDAGIKGGPGGVNKIDLSWELILTSGKTIKINPGAGGVYSPTFFGFNSDGSGGGIGLPAGSSFDDRLDGVLITNAGLTGVNRFYPKVSNTLYEAVDAGVTYQLINQAGTWSLDIVGANNPQYTSVDLVTWANAGGGLPAPTGEFSTRETTLTVGTSTWVFGQDGGLTLPGTIKAPITNDVSIETKSLSDPPTTITISGADFTPVNLTYTRDPLRLMPTWVPENYEEGVDPFIFFDGGWGIVVIGVSSNPIYVNTGTLITPLAQWNTNPPLGSVAPTGVYTYPSTYTHTWTFGTDGTTTLPQGGTISEVTVTPFIGGNPSVGILLTPFVSDEFGTPNPDMAVKIYPTFNDDDHIHIVAGNPGTVDLFLGDDIQYVKLENDGGNVVISADDPVGIKWTFDVNGRLTLPKNSSVREVTPATGAAAHVIVIQNASSILNTSFASLPPAPISNYVVPGTDIVVNVTWSTNGEDYHAPAFVVVDGGSGHTGGGESGGGDVLTVPYADMGISGGGNWTWYVVDIASDVVLTAGLESWRFAGDGSLTFPDATVQTTALVQGEQVFTLDTGAIDYAPTAVDFNLLFVTAAIGYSGTDPTSVTLPNGTPGQRLVIFNGYNLATLTVNPGPFGRDISSGVVAEFIYSGFDGLWMPLYGSNSPP